MMTGVCNIPSQVSHYKESRDKQRTSAIHKSTTWPVVLPLQKSEISTFMTHTNSESAHASEQVKFIHYQSINQPINQGDFINVWLQYQT